MAEFQTVWCLAIKSKYTWIYSSKEFTNSKDAGHAAINYRAVCALNGFDLNVYVLRVTK